MITKIWLVRHGESKSQTKEAGWADPGLSNRGVSQAERLRPILNHINFAHAFISPLQRARQTYELAKVAADDAHFDSRIVECSYGRTYDEILPYSTPAFAQADQYDAWNEPVEQRVKSFAADLRKCKGRRVLIVGHWALFSMLVQHLLGKKNLREPYSDESVQCLVMENAAISEMVLGHHRFGDALVRWNSYSHVEDLVSLTIDPSLP